MTTRTLLVYRGIWATRQELEALKSQKPLFPNGIQSYTELAQLKATALHNFGSLRVAALHHLTGAVGVAPNQPGKSLFTFWSRRREIAIQHIWQSISNPSKSIPILISADIGVDDNVIIAAEQGLYDERIAEHLEDTFEDFSPEDEVFISKPIFNYVIEILNIGPLLNKSKQ
jgi:hypothetical protein